MSLASATLSGLVEPTPANLRLAREYLRLKWRDRALEMDRPVPSGLAGSCKFAALFAQQLFGGQLRSNFAHDFVVRQGQVIDLTQAAGVNLGEFYAHVPSHHLHPEHVASLRSNLPRVASWMAGWREQELALARDLAPAL